MKVELKAGIHWVGAIDWNIRNFHGYSTHKGTTYNAYLVVGEKIALVDTVKAPFYGEMLERINNIMAPEEIDYLIVNQKTRCSQFGKIAPVFCDLNLQYALQSLIISNNW